MAGSTRIVERLRLRADSESAVRRTALALEDAFRTATLPDAGGRVICVRRLHLGRLPAGASPQTLSLLLESRFSGANWTMRHGGDDNAESADAVWFADALEAHQIAALRLASRRTLSEWFWRLALPTVAKSDTLPGHSQLRAIAFAVASMEEAPSALPAWTATMIRAGHRERLVSALLAGDGHALASSARIDGFRRWIQAIAARRPAFRDPERTSSASVSNVGPGSADFAPSDAPRTAAHDDRIAFLEFVMRREAAEELVRRPRTTNTGPPRTVEVGDGAAQSPARARVDRDSTPESTQPRSSVPAEHHSSVSSDDTAVSSIGMSVPSQSDDALAERQNESTPKADLVRWAVLDGEPTIAGGLLFLLPVLDRLGFAAWCDAAPDPIHANKIVRQIFHLLLSRLDIAEDDPAWALAVAPEHDRVPSAFRRKAALANRWLTRCRQLLRRHARIGLASLVCRPARLTITRTHIDVSFRLKTADVRIRRAGLDVDPGWLPWFGRVVTFHYEDRPWN